MVQVRATLYDRPAIDNSDLGPPLVNYSEPTVSRINATGNQVKGLLISDVSSSFRAFEYQ